METKYVILGAEEDPYDSHTGDDARVEPGDGLKKTQLMLVHSGVWQGAPRMFKAALLVHQFRSTLDSKQVIGKSRETHWFTETRVRRVEKKACLERKELILIVKTLEEIKYFKAKLNKVEIHNIYEVLGPLIKT
ncbi:hypothetical protein V6N13_037554 [Hibiscus sabdariffa]|uniref:Uncharacterized protein n=1 Tax=Hibiscus sabdariffa TaxID=183260 RepID=A0ABR2S5K1_9ROSI